MADTARSVLTRHILTWWPLVPPDVEAVFCRHHEVDEITAETLRHLDADALSELSYLVRTWRAHSRGDTPSPVESDHAKYFPVSSVASLELLRDDPAAVQRLVERQKTYVGMPGFHYGG